MAPALRSPTGTRALFILGAPRSGTSLLYKLVCLHRDAAWITNWQRRVPGLSPLAALGRVPAALPERRRTAWFGTDSNAYVYGRRRGVAERLFPMPVEGEPLFAHCGVAEYVDAASVSTVASERLRRAYAGLARYSGAPVVVSKRIGHNYRLPALRAAFPDAVFVNLVRDGRAVAASLLKVDWWPDTYLAWAGLTPKEWERQGRDPWELAAQEWVDEVQAVDRGLDGIDPGQVVQLRYEQFVADPAAHLERIRVAAGLGADPAWIPEVLRLEYPKGAEGWRTSLAGAALATVEAIQKPHLEKYGYAV